MGWLFGYSGGRKELLARLADPSRFSTGYKILRSMPVGNNHWYLMESPSGKKTIGLDLMQSGGREHGWGYKSISEEMGPTEVNCPLWLIDNATAPERYAYEWRQRVRAHHASKKARKVALVPGCRVRYGGTVYVLEASLGRRGWNVRSEHGGAFRMKAHQVASAEVLEL